VLDADELEVLDADVALELEAVAAEVALLALLLLDA